MTARLTLAIAATLLLTAGGCPTRDLSGMEPNNCSEQYKDIAVEINRSIDLLFVIDNSASMAEEQASLAANFDRFVDVMEGVEGGLLSIHLGVISTDLGVGPYPVNGCSANGDNGRLQSSPRVDGCSPPDGAFIRNVVNPDGTRTQNYTGELADTFACIARLGTDGCGFEQPLEAMRRALDGSNPENQGFLRPGAFLLVVFITDEDDCSASDSGLFDPAATELGPLSSFRCFEYGTECDQSDPRTPEVKTGCVPRVGAPLVRDIEPYVEFLRGLKADPNMVMVSGIVGDAAPVEVVLDGDGAPMMSPSCGSAVGEAAPAIRLTAFAELFPQRNTVTTICNEDLSDALIAVANLLASTLALPCVEGEIDLDPTTPGVQHDCYVSDVRYPGQDRQEETPIPPCVTDTGSGSGEVPCWRLEVNAMGCRDTPTQTVLRVDRGYTEVPDGTHTILRCLTAGCVE